MTSRRNFIKTCAAAFSSTPLLETASKRKYGKNLFPLPPGAVSLDRFLSKCTACHLCVSHCPTHTLRPAITENGLRGFMMPIMEYDVHQFCEFECNKCMEVCPTDALVEVPLEEKKLIQVGVAVLVLENCIVIRDQEDCGACAEHCPTAALQMVSYENGLTQPRMVEPDACIGCGGCESICPELKNAIRIERHEVHQQAVPPKMEVQKAVELDGFGF